MTKECLIFGSSKQVTVSIIEDDPFVRDRLTDVINKSSDFLLGFTCSSLKQGIREIQVTPSEVLLLDLGLPDGSGIELIKFITNQSIATGVIVITAFSDEKSILEAISAGAVGYLLKDEEHQKIEDSIRQMLNGGSPISPGIARYLLKQFRVKGEDAQTQVKSMKKTGLTRRELDILQKIAKGFTSKEISEMENLSYHTVTTHIRNVYKKLSVNSRAEALFEAYNIGLL